MIEGPPPIRLVDHLAAAEISSPLLAAPPLDELLADLDRLGATEVWRTEFREPGEERQRGCRALAEGGIDCRDDGSGFRLRLELPVVDAAFSVIVLELQTERPECVIVNLWDGADRVRLSLPNGAGGWRRVPLLWPGRPGASELALTLMEEFFTGPCAVAVRSVSIYRLDSSRELRLALLRGHRAGGAGSEAAIRGFGVFLPLSDAETVRPPFDENFSSREVLLAPAPTELRFRVRVPRRARLAFSYALSRETEPGTPVEFEVRARTGAAERLLWSGRLAAEPESWHWHEASVPLTEFAGRTAELVLATRSAGAGLGIWGTPTVEAARRHGGPPNVILIAVDTLRADRLSAYGYGEPTSPRLAELAADGVLFRHATSQSNWTLPSFASIFTGKIVPRHRLATFVSGLPASAVTLQGLFRAHGWRTQAVLYKGALYRQLHHGFESVFNVPLVNHRADRNLATALDRLERLGDQRFFLFLHFDDPHQPFTQPEEYLGAGSAERLRELGLEMPLTLLSELAGCPRCKVDGRPSAAVRELANRLYDEEVRYADEMIGRFLDELRRRGLYDEAVVAFVSDHGETLWSHYDFFAHGGANLHDELIRVPLIVKPPAGRGYRRGAVVPSRVRAFDLMPTLLGLAGIEAQGELDAVSLAPLLAVDGGAAPAADRIAFSQGSASAALLFERWKYIMPVGRGVHGNLPPLTGEGLYDLVADPGELSNLAERQPERLRELRWRAVEYVTEAVGGRFLLVAGGARGRLEVACEPGCEWRPLVQFGLELTGPAGRGVSVFQGPGLGGEVLLAGLAAGSGEPVRVQTAGAGAPAPAAEVRPVAFESGLVAELLERPGLGAWLISTPERQSDRPEAAEIDPRQEKALRALGYLE